MIGSAIAKARQGAGLTQEELAARLGITRSAVAQWETNLCDPTIKTLIDLLRALDVTPDQILKEHV